MAQAEEKPRRQRNPRGQGDRLRGEIIGAASRLLAGAGSPPLTLRAVGREAGLAATSVYLHFANVESLALAVAEQRFGELAKLQDSVRDEAATAAERLRAECLAYCEFGLSNPGHYQVMFAHPLPPGEYRTVQDMPGYATVQQLIDAVAECAGRPAADPEALRTGLLLWQQLHGIVSLRIARPLVPWPPLAETVTDAVTRLLG